MALPHERATLSEDGRTLSGGIPVLDDRYGNVWTDVPEGKPLLYLNSLENVALAINDRNFAGKYGIQAAGPDWRVTIQHTTSP